MALGVAEEVDCGGHGGVVRAVVMWLWRNWDGWIGLRCFLGFVKMCFCFCGSTAVTLLLDAIDESCRAYKAV